jgi:hypothetical protein
VAFFSQKMGQFSYFSMQLGEPDWRGKDVLDFGGNIGNILRDQNSTIDEERYSCIDVDREAIESGMADFPKSHWYFYNRYCFFFNPLGQLGLALPDFNQRFDYIVSYSVFTNTVRSEMLDLVEQLKTLLNDNGKLAFTFIDPGYRSWPNKYAGNNLRWRLERDNKDKPDVDIAALVAEADQAQWCILLNGTDLYLETETLRPCPVDQQKSCHVYYSEAYMKSLFPDAVIMPPANNEMQHCCIIG